MNLLNNSGSRAIRTKGHIGEPDSWSFAELKTIRKVGGSFRDDIERTNRNILEMKRQIAIIQSQSMTSKRNQASRSSTLADLLLQRMRALRKFGTSSKPKMIPN